MTMTLQRQAEQSGLCFLDSDNNSNEPHWNTNDWPPLLGGWRQYHASVVLDHPEQDDRAQTVVVLGGDKQDQRNTNSVLLMNLAEENKQWREGPPLNDTRACHAAVVCSGGVYVIGGWNGSSDLNNIERIDVANLCSESMESSTSNQWTILTCRLSTARDGCSAVAVHNRFIVVIGGFNGSDLSSVDVIDTAVKSNHTVIAGPSMTVPRYSCASAISGHRIYVVGGIYGCSSLTSVESLKFEGPSPDETLNTASAVFPSSCRWTLHHKLKLCVPRTSHAVVAVGSCLIVMGGLSTGRYDGEVLDTRRNTMWTIPRSTGPLDVSSAVVHSRGMTLIGGDDNASCATLSLSDKNTWCFRRLTEQVPSRIFFEQVPSRIFTGQVPSVIIGTRTDSLRSTPVRTTVSKKSNERN